MEYNYEYLITELSTFIFTPSLAHHTVILKMKNPIPPLKNNAQTITALLPPRKEESVTSPFFSTGFSITKILIRPRLSPLDTYKLTTLRFILRDIQGVLTDLVHELVIEPRPSGGYEKDHSIMANEYKNSLGFDSFYDVGTS